MSAGINTGFFYRGGGGGGGGGGVGRGSGVGREENGWWGGKKFRGVGGWGSVLIPGAAVYLPRLFFITILHQQTIEQTKKSKSLSFSRNL